MVRRQGYHVMDVARSVIHSLRGRWTLYPAFGPFVSCLIFCGLDATGFLTTETCCCFEYDLFKRDFKAYRERTKRRKIQYMQPTRPRANPI